MKKLLRIVSVVLSFICLMAVTACGKGEKRKRAEYAFDAVPSEYTSEPAPEQGKIESVRFTLNEKNRLIYVYLPYGYDEADTSKKYNVLYLLHGAGEEAGYWFKKGSKYVSFSENKTVTMLDNLIYKKVCEPLIVVTPGTYDLLEDENCFRNLVVKTVEEKYHTFANGDTSDESLIASRNHRAMAGFSMGGMTTQSIGMEKNLNIISYFGCFTGSGTAQDLLNVLSQEENKDYKINFFYNGQGTFDLEITRTTQLAMVKGVLEDGRYFKENENFVLNDKEGKGHKYSCWIIDLYNVLAVSFF